MPEGPETDTQNDTVRFRRSNLEMRAGVYAVLGYGLVMIAVFAGVDFYHGKPVNWYVIAGIAGVAALISLVWVVPWLIALRDRSVQLEVSKNGILIPAIVARTMLWSDIVKIHFREQHSSESSHRDQVCIVVFLKNPEAYPSKQWRWVQFLGRKYYGSQYAYGLEALEGEPEDVQDAVEQLMPDHVEIGSEMKRT